MAQEDLFLIWQDATKQYADTTGMDIKGLLMPATTEDLFKIVEEQNSQFQHFREKQVGETGTGLARALVVVELYITGNCKRTIFAVLSATVETIETIGNMEAGSASAVFQPTEQVFGTAMCLVSAARGVSASLDAIVDLLSILKDFTVRLKVYNSEDLSQELREKLTEILIGPVRFTLDGNASKICRSLSSGYSLAPPK